MKSTWFLLLSTSLTVVCPALSDQGMRSSSSFVPSQNPAPLPFQAPVFGNPLVYIGNETLEVMTADFDDDGDLDFAVGRGGSYGVTISLNNGYGKFSDPIKYNMYYDTHAESIDIADVDGDNDLDIVAAGTQNWSSEANYVTVLYNAGDATFNDHWTAPDSAGPEPKAVRFGDLDGMNGPDIVVISDINGSLRVYLNDGTGHYPSVTNIPVGHGCKWLDVADFNGDNDDDVVVVSSDGAAILFNDGTGNLVIDNSYPIGPNPLYVTAADLDGENGLDLAVSHGYGSSYGITVLLNNGSGAFASAGTYMNGQTNRSVHAVDINNDGMTDLAVPYSPSVEDGTVTILLNIGDGLFSNSTSYRTGFGAIFVASGDLDADGWTDLAVGNDGQAGKHVTFLLSNGDGTYSDHLGLSAGSQLAPIPLGAKDFDGDDVPDLLASDFNQEFIHFWHGNGDGTFAEVFSYPTGGHQLFVTGDTGDIDGDQDLDAVCISNTGAAVFSNDGTGVFTLMGHYSIAGQPGGVAWGDLDGDEDLDMAVSNYNATFNSLNVYVNDGNGSFGSPTQYDGGEQPYGVTIADIDNDNDNDVLLAAYPHLAVVRNNGDASFQTPELYDAGESPFDILCAHLNDDEHVDVVVTDPGGFSSSPFVQIFLNNGDGTFAPKVTYEAGSAAAEITAVDINADGAIDLATANWFGEDSLSVLLNDGNGAFDNETKYHVGFFSRGIVSADFDTDGDVDLASGSVMAATFDYGEVSVLFNRTTGCLGDVNSDRVVNIDDIFQILGAWGPCYDCLEDINDDSTVNIDDIFTILGLWGPCS